VNGRAINHLNAARIDEIATLVRNAQPLTAWPESFFHIEDNIRRRDQQLSVQSNNGDALRKALQLGKDNIMQQLTQSALRGRGGAGFKTAAKWDYCLHSESTQRYVVCNADEGEPGTFKDRVLLNSYTHSVIEGMVICALVTGAREGFIYLRAEYSHLLDHLQGVLQKQRELNLLGNNILGRDGLDFDIQIHLGAGAYICGEESALIESLEGKRGVPRVRPPFPVISGYKNKPTVVDNVETFWSVSLIMLQGSDWFTAQGSELSRGTRLLSISGDCARPGIYEYPFGVSLKQILEDCAGQDAQAIQIAGAAGHLVLAKDFERCMSFEDLPTGGSFMVIGPQRNLLDMLQNFAHFFKHESCGFCTPCRVGTRVIAELIDRFKNGQGSRIDLHQLSQTARLMQKSSFCGLGCSVPTVFLDALEHCPELFEKGMGADPDNPVFDLEQAVSEFNQLSRSSIKGA
jgi:[NiFe] hydrogenase diaphorase moiety large subunit